MAVQCASPSTSSTLHHYCDRLSAIAERRFGVELMYDELPRWSLSVRRRGTV